MKYKCRRIRSVKLLFLSRDLHPLASLSMVLIISWALLLKASKTFGEPTQCLQVTPQHYRTYYGRLTLGSGVSYMRHNWISTLSWDPTFQGSSLWLCKYSNVQNPKVLLDLRILDKRDTTSPNRFSWVPQQEWRLHFPPHASRQASQAHFDSWISTAGHHCLQEAFPYQSSPMPETLPSLEPYFFLMEQGSSAKLLHFF